MMENHRGIGFRILVLGLFPVSSFQNGESAPTWPIYMYFLGQLAKTDDVFHIGVLNCHLQEIYFVVSWETIGI